MTPARRRPHPLGETALVVSAYLLYAQVRAAHGRTSARNEITATDHGRAVATLERTLHLDPERWLQTLVLPHPGVLRVMAAFYLLAHLTVTACTLAFLYVRRPAIYRRCRNALAVVTFAAVGVFALAPTAPPRLVSGSGIRDTLASTGGLWSYNHGALEHIADPYAAMPSLHLAWATWVAVSLVLAFPDRRWRWAVFTYPVAVALNVMATGNHWFFDTLAGSALLGAALGIAVAAERAVCVWRDGWRRVGDTAPARTP